jgi:uncharacterized protein
MLTPTQIISMLRLEPLPVEGGLFRQTYLAPETVMKEALPDRYNRDKQICSAIYYLLHEDHFSALHRLPTDEIYHFYLGDPVELLLLFEDGKSEVVVLGTDLAAGQSVQLVVPHGVWQGSHLIPGGRFALMGTTMAPAYDDLDFDLGDRQDLLHDYPERTTLIQALTA